MSKTKEVLVSIPSWNSITVKVPVDADRDDILQAINEDEIIQESLNWDEALIDGQGIRD